MILMKIWSTLTLPDSINGRLWGEPLSTNRTLKHIYMCKCHNYVRGNYVKGKLKKESWQDRTWYLSWRSALMSTYTVVGSGPEVPCSQSQQTQWACDQNQTPVTAAPVSSEIKSICHEIKTYFLSTGVFSGSCNSEMKLAIPLPTPFRTKTILYNTSVV